MAGLGFKDFQVGEVLTSSDVDGYLMQQSVMRFADAGARGSALGTAVGTGVALAEGMVSYLDDTNTVQVYNGTAWAVVGGFDASVKITATDASWTVPALGNGLVKVTVIGGGGGGSSSVGGTSGSSGGVSTFGSGASFELSAAGGAGGVTRPGVVGATNGAAGNAGNAAENGGQGSSNIAAAGEYDTGQKGNGGAIEIGYIDLTGVSTVNVIVGAGGAGGTGAGTGGAGGRGEIIVEYKAG